MNKPVASINCPSRLTVLAALLASLSAPALAESRNVVISQVYGGGGNSGAVYKNDFIELFNRGTTAVPLRNWSVQYASATGTGNWSVTALPDDAVIEAGGYYIVREAAGTGGTVDVPADATGTIAMSGTAFKAAVASNRTALSGAKPTSSALVDMVGVGNTSGSTANGFEGTGPTRTLSNTTSVSRKLAGCQDTDDNAADFDTPVAPAPRSKATTPNVCGGPAVEPLVLSCPATVLRPHGAAGTGLLSAIDKDSRVTGFSIASGGVPGIRIENLVASSADDSAGTAELVVDASVAPGSYPLVINVSNDDNQSKTCSVTVHAADTHTIPAIQGPGAASPYANTAQTTEGVVTAKVGSGFFIQDAAGDANPQTSDAVYVFGASNAAVGDLVRVTGLVSEYRPVANGDTYTELTSPITTVLGAGPAVTPANVAIPQASLEPFEGMLVRVTNTLTVNDNSFLGTRGELTLADGRREIPTNRYRAGTLEAKAMAAANALNQLVLDDGIFSTPQTVPYIGDDGTVRAGDTVTDLVGVLDFGVNGGGDAVFKLQPTAVPSFSRSNPRPAAPVLPAGVKVASANVLNFFTTFTDGGNAAGETGQGCTIGSTTRASNCRGANNMAEFVRQRDKIVNSLVALNADVVGLMEIQNSGDDAVSYLVDSINGVMGGKVYAVVPKPLDTGTDAIRVAMIYKPAVVTLAGASLSDSDEVNNRPPMAQTFKARNGAKFSVIVNHLKAKAGCPSGTGLDSDHGDGQGCWNNTRVRQAQRLATGFIPQVQAAAGDSDVLVIGDMNAYGFEDPIATLTGSGMVNQIERFVRPQGKAYSYVFDGLLGYLDHALTTASLSEQVAGAAEWHNNADEPEAVDYNIDTRPHDLYANNPYRASDHDPVLVSLALTPTFVDVTSSLRIVQSGLAVKYADMKYTGKVMFTNTGTTTLKGPLHFVLEGLTEGVVLNGASGTHEDAPYVTLPETTIAPGAKVTVDISFTYPAKKKEISYTPKMYSGTF